MDEELTQAVKAACIALLIEKAEKDAVEAMAFRRAAGKRTLEGKAWLLLAQERYRLMEELSDTWDSMQD